MAGRNLESLMKTIRYSLAVLLSLLLLSACDNDSNPVMEQPGASSQQGSVHSPEPDPAVSDSVSEPLISPDAAKHMEPALRDWLTFHDLDITGFRLMSHAELDIYAPGDGDKYYHEAFDPAWHGQYKPVIRDYAPGKRRYINLLEATLVHEEDGVWHFKGSDDNQQIRLVDLDAERSIMFFFTGTLFVDAAFWIDDDEFLLVQYDDFNKDYLIRLFNLADKTLSIYRQHAESPPGHSYLQQNMENRGIIID